jgi:hypothetical protein
MEINKGTFGALTLDILQTIVNQSNKGMFLALSRIALVANNVHFSAMELLEMS